MTGYEGRINEINYRLMGEGEGEVVLYSRVILESELIRKCDWCTRPTKCDIGILLLFGKILEQDGFSSQVFTSCT